MKYKGMIYVLLSAICFSLGGVLIKAVPWGSISINGARSIFAFFTVLIYMKATKHKIVFNKMVALGTAVIFIMALTFVMANKATSAANAIVLQFTEPIFVILLMWAIYKKRPNKEAVITCIVVFAGILCFFMDSISAGGNLGNVLAIVSGITYAGVFLIKSFKDSDFESSLLFSQALSFVVAIPNMAGENVISAKIIVIIIVMGVIQNGVSYIFLSKGLDYVSPVTASLTSTIEPILNPILVAIVYGETIGIISFIGAILVIGAATIYNVRSATNSEEAKTAQVN